LNPLPEVTPGLRERKKLKTRTAIQREAMRLFQERGFQATTIDEIADAVEISPSTFFNYFATKEDVVMQDDLDPLIMAAFNAQPPKLGPITALRNAMTSVFAELPPEQDTLMRQRMTLIAADSELRAAMFNQFAGLVDEVARVLAVRTGRSSADFALRNLAGALMGVFMSAVLTAAEDPQTDLVRLIDQAMAHLEAGLPL
jgi:AcrR family transcriptional regulator